MNHVAKKFKFFVAKQHNIGLVPDNRQAELTNYLLLDIRNTAHPRAEALLFWIDHHAKM